jgi:hypothetical protein
MKVTKSSVHRLSIEKGCGCKATREYEDARYAKPLAEASFAACDKHKAKKDFAEFAGEMLIEALDKEAETAGKNTFVSSSRQVEVGDTGGLVATAEAGGSVQAMGVVMPKRREPRDPLEQKNARMAVPQGPARPSHTDPTGHLNIAQPLTDEELAEAGITMDGSIEGVAADPNVDADVEDSLDAMSGYLDAQDAKEQGVPLALLKDAD